MGVSEFVLIEFLSLSLLLNVGRTYKSFLGELGLKGVLIFNLRCLPEFMDSFLSGYVGEAWKVSVSALCSDRHS